MAEAQTDLAFVQFKSLEYGWRAAFHLLTRTYYHKYRLLHHQDYRQQVGTIE